jgi:hypothetical protein
VHRHHLQAPQIREIYGHGRQALSRSVSDNLLEFVDCSVGEGDRHCSACWQQQLSSRVRLATAQAANGAQTLLTDNQHATQRSPRLRPAYVLAAWLYFGVKLACLAFVTFASGKAGSRIPCRLISGLGNLFFTTCCTTLEMMTYAR